MRISAEADLAVVGEAPCDEEAPTLVEQLLPDIVLVDADMAEMRGVITASRIHNLIPQAAIVILSIQDDDVSCEQAEKAGAVAFISKLMPTEMLLAAIRQVTGHAN